MLLCCLKGTTQTVRGQLTEAERVYGLSHIWSEAKYNFVYFDRLAIDWDSLYLATLPKVLAATNTKDYYDVLRWFAAQLKDGHTGVWYPSSFYQKEAAFAPLQTDLIDGRVFITAVPDDSLRNEGWHKGMEILKINGEDVHLYAQALAPLESASTPQGLNGAVYNLYLLNGPINEALQLTVRDKGGKVFDKKVWRSNKRPELPAVQYRELENKIGLLAINSFAGNGFMKVFDSVYKQILNTQALIIDLRQNTGGNGSQGEYLLKHLVTTPFPEPQISSRQYNPLLKAWGQSTISLYTMLPGSTQPFTDRPIYKNPVVVLTGNLTASAAEDFTMQFDAVKRGLIVGQPTAGTTGQPIFSTLPGGGTLRVCVRKDAYPDGKEFVGKGIQPSLEIKESADSFRNGEDRVLFHALQEIKKVMRN